MQIAQRSGLIALMGLLAAGMAGCNTADQSGFNAETVAVPAQQGGRPAAPPTSTGRAAPGKSVPVVNLSPPRDDEDRVTITAMRSDRKGSLADYLRALSDASCHPGAVAPAIETSAIKATPVPLQSINPGRTQVGELTFVGGFALTSPDKRFGNLSGLDILDNGNLLAVSDQGDFVWIDMATDGLTPVRARIAPMTGRMGDTLRGSAEGDAEGLAVNGGMALVSFERDHRILAFDLGKCGAAARGAPIVFGAFGEALPDAFDDADLAVGDNRGVESLAVTSDWYMFAGVETKIGDLSPMSGRPIEAEPSFDLRVGVEEPEFVGLDIVAAGSNKRDVRAFLLHRSFSPEADNAIVITETDFKRFTDDYPRRIGGELDDRFHQRFIETGWRNLAELNFLLTIDNFEGIAAKELPDGRVRLFLISDDDGSPTHRTLLMVFDVPRPRR